MNLERQEQLKALVETISHMSGNYAYAVRRVDLSCAATELRRLAEVEQELEQWKTLGESSIATHQNILHGKVKLSREAALHIAGAQDHDQLKAQTESAIAERDDALAKLAEYQAAMQRERAPAWEKQLKYLSAELRSASEYPAISPKYITAEDLQMASIKLFEMATVFTHKANFVPCELALNESKEVIESALAVAPGILDDETAHFSKMCGKALANITATLQGLEATEP